MTTAPTLKHKIFTRMSANGLVIEDTKSLLHPLNFIDIILRGIGQVMLQNNSYTGLFFLIGIFYHSIMFGMVVLLGTSISTSTAIFFGANRHYIRTGLFGFNGALVAIALPVLLGSEGPILAYIVFAAICTSIFMAAFLRLLDIWKAPTLTAPFVLSTILFTLAATNTEQLHLMAVAPPSITKMTESALTLSALIEGTLNGIAQVFLQENIITGIFFVIGLLISSRAACVAALLGSFMGLLVAWGVGDSESAIRAGIYGFNPALTAIALGSGYFLLSTVSVIYTMLAVLATSIVFAAMSVTLKPFGIPVLTAPFVLVVWLFLLASPLFQRLQLNSHISSDV